MRSHEKKSAKGIHHYDLWIMIATFRTGISDRIPLGYQDELGFHYGIEPIASFLERLMESPAT